MTDTTPLAPTDAEIEELLKSCGMRWAERSYWLLEDADLHPAIRTAIAKWGAPAPASGEVVVTCAPCGRCVAVTRQDDEGRILSVIWVEPTQDEPILRTAAQSLIDRWDTPLWKDAEHTGAFIQRLREALAVSPAQKPKRPLSDAQVLELLHSSHFHKKYVLKDSDRTLIAWYRQGLRDGERAHGITAAQKETP